MVQEVQMKRKRSNNSSLDKQVDNVIDFMSSHEWAFPMAIPLNLHKDLDNLTERYLFDSYIDMNYAYQNYLKGDYIEAEKRLEYSKIWKDEAFDCSFYSGTNNLKTLLFKKTEKIFDNILHEICSDKKYLDAITPNT
jgi:hypothetical protein